MNFGASLRIFALLTTMLLAGQLSAQQISSTLAKLDAASARFTNAQASFHNEDYTALVKDTSSQDGITYAIRTKSGATDMGIKVVGTGARTVQYRNGTVKDFNPGTGCYNSVSATKSRSTIDSFLTLAFGTSGKDLAKAWTINDQGPETLSDDGKPVKVEKLDLTPKDSGVANNVTHITVWIDPERAVSLKLIFFSPSGDKHTATYSHVRLNESRVDTKPFDFKDKPCGK